jgi:ABC-2 type transport system permease protein
VTAIGLPRVQAGGELSWLRVRTVVRRLAYVVSRSPHRWFEVLIFPCIDVLLWGSLGAFVAEENGASQASATYLLAGIMLNNLLFQTEVSVATGFMEETWSRNLLNVMTTPVREVEYIIGIGIYGLAKLVVAMCAVSVAAVGFFGFGLAELGWGVLPIMLALLVTGWAMGLFMIGLILRFGQSAEILTWAMPFLVLALSGVFNPIRAVPGALQPVSHLLPTTYAFEAGRALLNGDAMPWGDLLWAGAGGVLLVVLAAWFATRMLATFRERGFVTRYS